MTIYHEYNGSEIYHDNNEKSDQNGDFDVDDECFKTSAQGW